MNGDFMHDANPSGSVVEYEYSNGVQVSLEDTSKPEEDEEEMVVSDSKASISDPLNDEIRSSKSLSFSLASEPAVPPSTAQFTLPRHSRESVLQRLSEALLRRSLTKVRVFRVIHHVVMVDFEAKVNLLLSDRL